jgi:hypothetical protein
VRSFVLAVLAVFAVLVVFPPLVVAGLLTAPLGATEGLLFRAGRET